VNEIAKIQRSNLVLGMPVLEPVIGGDSMQERIPQIHPFKPEMPGDKIAIQQSK
jgi:hypothetical protein